MFYILNHDGKLEQGDICFNIPKITPSQFISEKPIVSTWDDYINCIEENSPKSVKFSFFPSPTQGVILSPTCDIENNKLKVILFAELKLDVNHSGFQEKGKSRKKSHIDSLLRLVRYKWPSKHYFPELFVDETIYGPWELDFNNIFFISTELVKKNIDLFWKARLKSPAVEVLKEKIRHYFTRLAFDECIFLTDIENDFYIEYKDKDKEEIDKIRSSCDL